MKKSERWRSGMDWPTLIFLIVFHAGAVAALFFLSWQGVGAALLLSVLTGLGITVGFHRSFNHPSFKTNRFVRWWLAFVGQLAGQSSVLWWVLQHRRHHAHSDGVGDPHSPNDGPVWAHMLWFLPRIPTEELPTLYERYVPDLLQDRMVLFLHRTYFVWHVLLGVALFAVGWLFWGVSLGVSLFMCGMFLRTVFGLHMTWAVNSVGHLWGRRLTETSDRSRNVAVPGITWLLDILTLGELTGHNNHHADPNCARLSHIDPGYRLIVALEYVGLVWDVRHGHREGVWAR